MYRPKGCVKLVVEGTAPVDRSRKTWQDSVSVDFSLMVSTHGMLRAVAGGGGRAVGRKTKLGKP